MKNAEIREPLGLEMVSVVIKEGRWRWFGHVEYEDDANWIKQCVTMLVNGIRQTKRKTW